MPRSSALRDFSKWRLGTRVTLFLTLTAAGLAGNYFKSPVFLNIDFLFGSVFAMLALQVFGLGRGILAAALIASVTYAHWNHPYAIIILTLEVAAVWWMIRRLQIGLVLADAIYWLIIGMPLVFLFYYGVMDVPWGNTSMVMIKQAVNGIANALLARLLITGFVLGARQGQVTYRDLIYNLLAFFALYPALILLMVAGHSDFIETDRNIRSELLHNSRLVSNRIDVWARNRASSIATLAALSTTLTPQQMQLRLEQAHASDENFLRIGLMDKEATSTAFSPLTDELGHSNIKLNFANRSFVAKLKQSLKPMLSQVMMGSVGTPKPFVTMLAPVMRANAYDGYIAGALSLAQLHEFLEKNTLANTMLFTLLDKNGNVVLSNRQDQSVMRPFVRTAGSLNRLDSAISQWVPRLPSNTPISEQWRSSFYVVETPVGSFAEWRLILEQPVAPFQKLLYARYTGLLALLFVLLLTALALAEFLSRKVAARTEQLSEFAKHLPEGLGMGAQPIWPESNLVEHDHLIDKFKAMAVALAAQFSANRELTASLERRVVQRTEALAASEEKYRLLIENSHDIIYTLNSDGVFTFVSPAWTALLGHRLSEVLGQPFMGFVHPDDLPLCMTALHQLFKTGDLQTDIEYRVKHTDGTWHWHTSSALPMKDESGTVTGFEGIAKDITVQRGLENTVRQLAFYDPLTQLPNRRLLNDRLSQSMAASRRTACYGALMFLDLDNFKSLNDTHGHGAGDLLLIEVANRLTACVRQMDTVARYGGDEFVVMLGELGTDKVESTWQAGVVAKKIRINLSAPYLLTVDRSAGVDRVIEHRCTASIGVVVFITHEVTLEDIVKSADAAMYRAKAAGRNSISFDE